MHFAHGIVASVFFIVGIAGDVSAAEEKKPAGGEKKELHAIIKTKFGDMEIKFFPELAPKTVESFVKLAKSGFFDKTLFHRVIPGFMIQGGDPNTKDPDKKREYGIGGPGYNLPDEFSATTHKRGIVSMANTGRPNSSGSQFFIMVVDNPGLDRKYSVFGEVIKGMEVADKIASVPREAPGQLDRPVERVEMTVTVVEK